jgi:hypothetical protein
VAVSTAEVEALTRAGAASLYRGIGQPFTEAGRGISLVGRREDGVCGFLADDRRCSIHAELGAKLKPLTCRMFPFRVHAATAGAAIVSSSLSCPTVAANEGAPVSRDAGLPALAESWLRAFPEKPARVEMVAGRSLSPPAADALQGTLRALIDRGGDLRTSILRVADLLEDLTRWRARRMSEDAFSEYVQIMARHAGASDAPPRSAPLPGLTLATRGVLLAVAATRAQLAGEGGFGLRLRLLRLVAHLHGIGRGSAGVDVSQARAARLDAEDPELRRLLQHALRVGIAGLGSSRQPLVEELGTHAALLHAATLLARQRAGASGRDRATAEDLLAVLPETMDVLLASGSFASLVRRLGGGVTALRQLAA